jgi:vesicle coat complex subunit
VIKEYVVAGGEGMELTPKQQQLYERWVVTDEMIRSNRGKLTRGEIAEQLKNRNQISLCTAKADMVAAEDVFASSNPLNKKYLIQSRIEFLEKEIRLASTSGDYDAVSKLEKVLCKYIEIYPETPAGRGHRQVIFNLQQNILNGQTLPTEEAVSVIDQALKLIEDDTD